MSALIVFRTLMHAQRGARALSGEGVPVNVVKAPRDADENGCAYAVRMSEKYVDRARLLLREKDLPFGKIYHSGEDGRYREIRP